MLERNVHAHKECTQQRALHDEEVFNSIAQTWHRMILCCWHGAERARVSAATPARAHEAPCGPPSPRAAVAPTPLRPCHVVTWP